MGNNKVTNSFGGIVAVIGSILIVLGVAWLLAQNWHQIPSALKIIILLTVTGIAYFSATMFRIRGYHKIGEALLILGGLLYTLSIFLIAQTFHFKASIEGTAFLLLLSWTGIYASAYIFNSPSLIIIALLEFEVWLIVQFFAFKDKTIGVLGFYLLTAGVLFYALSLLHRFKEHKFSKIYQWWTAFYFLAFTYLLSFQTLLPYIWGSGAIKFHTSSIFLLFFLGLALMLLIIAIIKSVNKKIVSGKELYGIIAVIILLTVLIISTGLVSVSNLKSGNCYSLSKIPPSPNCQAYKNETSCVNDNCKWTEITSCRDRGCSNYQDEFSCRNAPSDLNCEWNSPICREKDCSNFRDTDPCEGSRGCPPIRNDITCSSKSCYNYKVQSSCESAGTNCVWFNNYCQPLNKGCYVINSKEYCLKSECEWIITPSCNNDYANLRATTRISNTEIELCNSYKDEALCQQNTECRWTQSRYYSEIFGRDKKDVPLRLWVIWIIINLFFIMLILGIIGYGSWQRLPAIINLGIVFFVLDIITRYIGFLIDLWGYTSLSLLFIAGGIILIIVGWRIEKWRRNLIANTKNTAKTNAITKRIK